MFSHLCFLTREGFLLVFLELIMQMDVACAIQRAHVEHSFLGSLFLMGTVVVLRCIGA